jgi:hypothetical protein
MQHDMWRQHQAKQYHQNSTTQQQASGLQNSHQVTYQLSKTSAEQNTSAAQAAQKEKAAVQQNINRAGLTQKEKAAVQQHISTTGTMHGSKAAGLMHESKVAGAALLGSNIIPRLQCSKTSAQQGQHGWGGSRGNAAGGRRQQG